MTGSSAVSRYQYAAPARNEERVGIVVQARMGSSRLPGKVLIPIRGKPLLRRLCNRIGICRRIDCVVVATTDCAADQVIEDNCVAWGVPIFRGSEQDVLKRLLRAGQAYGLTALVRVTADNPLTDPEGIDELIQLLQESKPGLVHSNHRMGYPYGTGAEVISMSAMEIIDREAASKFDREHVTSFAHRDPKRFTCIKLNAPPELLRPQYFLSADYPEDIRLLDAVYLHFGGRDDVPLQDIVNFLDSEPSLCRINSHLHQQFS